MACRMVMIAERSTRASTGVKIDLTNLNIVIRTAVAVTRIKVIRVSIVTRIVVISTARARPGIKRSMAPVVPVRIRSERKKVARPLLRIKSANTRVVVPHRRIRRKTGEQEQRTSQIQFKFF